MQNNTMSADEAVDFGDVFRHAPSSYMILDRELRYINVNECYCTVVGMPRDALIGRKVFDVFPEEGERLDRFKEAFERAVDGERNCVVRQLYRMPDADGTMRDVWWTCHHEPVRDLSGRICGVLQNANDVTAEVQAEQLRDVVLCELDHRMKNQLATISAIARRTARDAETTDEFLDSFDRRLQAMARTHQMLVDGQWNGLELGDLVRTELAPYGARNDGRIRISGPPVRLSPGEAQSLGLALHELSTNAAKYGGLGEHGQSLRVTWRDGDGRVELTWAEQASRAIVPPSRHGFGSVIVDKLLPSQIGATVQRDYHADGLHCRIDIPRNPSVDR